MVLTDLDKFKEVNDSFGHNVGDQLPKVVALALSHRMRQTDVLARVGGDEFAILLPQTGADQAGERRIHELTPSTELPYHRGALLFAENLDQ